MTDTVSASEKSKSSGNVMVILAIVGLVLLVAGVFFPVTLAPVEIKASVLTTVAGIPISNTLITGWISMIILIVLFRAATSSMLPVPGRLQSLAESVIGGLLDMAENMVGREKAREFFPLIATIFLFVLTNNWIELVPGFTNDTIYIGADKIPFFRSPSADLNFTLALALTAVAMVQFWSIKHTGVGGWGSKFINLSGGPIGFYVGILELVSEVAKVISFSFRLFGNLFAGDVLLSVIPSLVPWVVVLPFMGLEVFVGVVQAFVFAMLTLAFISMATISHAAHGGDHAAEHAH